MMMIIDQRVLYLSTTSTISDERASTVGRS